MCYIWCKFQKDVFKQKSESLKGKMIDSFHENLTTNKPMSTREETQLDDKFLSAFLFRRRYFDHIIDATIEELKRRCD
jgi:hypothetical protein